MTGRGAPGAGGRCPFGGLQKLFCLPVPHRWHRWLVRTDTVSTMMETLACTLLLDVHERGFEVTRLPPGNGPRVRLMARSSDGQVFTSADDEVLYAVVELTLLILASLSED
jgi:hypothetical protein